MKVGLIGYGYWGKIISNYLLNHDRFVLEKIYSPSLNSRDKFTNNLDEVISNSQIRAVFIATPLKTHYELAKIALESGKHVMCEKPLTISYREGVELKKISEEKGVMLETNYTYLYSNSIKKMKQLIRNEQNIQFVECTLKQLGRFYEEDVYSVLGCHMLSVLDYLFSLESMDFQFNNLITDENNVVTTGEIIFKKNSIRGKILVSLNTPFKERVITIYIKEGIIQYNPSSKNTLEYIEYKRQKSESLVTYSESYVYDENNNLKIMLDDFYDKINKKETENSNIAVSLKITSILENKNILFL